jgi:hypothetical protein
MMIVMVKAMAMAIVHKMITITPTDDLAVFV